MNIKAHLGIFFICYCCVADNLAFAACANGETQCGVDGYLIRCLKLSSAFNDYAWRSTNIRCNNVVENDKVCEPGFERCAPDGVIQKCVNSGDRWQTQPYRNCQAGTQATFEQEAVR